VRSANGGAVRRLVGIAVLALAFTGCSAAKMKQIEENRAERRAEEERIAKQVNEDRYRPIRITTNPEVVRGCAFVGNVRAEARNQEKLEEKLKEMAVALGGNVLMIVTNTPDAEGSGEAYRCAASPGVR
jgi:hypothetical protein